MVRICLSGLTSSGKDTLGELVSRQLNIALLNKASASTYTKEVKAHTGKESIHDKLKENEKLVRDSRIAKSFDDQIAGLAGKNDCVVTTWLGPWKVKDPTLTVWLDAGIDERARRRAAEDGISVKEAKEIITRKDNENIEGFRKLYGIDITDHSGFDIALNTQRFSLNEMVMIISFLTINREREKFK